MKHGIEEKMKSDEIARTVGGRTSWASDKKIPEVDRMDNKLHQNADTDSQKGDV